MIPPWEHPLLKRLGGGDCVRRSICCVEYIIDEAWGVVNPRVDPGVVIAAVDKGLHAGEVGGERGDF